MGASLTDQVRRLLDDAAAACEDGAAAETLRDARSRLDEPLRVAIAGKVKAGKSTLLNALVGEELAPTDAGECTRIVTWYRDGITYRVMLEPRDGVAHQTPFHRDGGAIDIDLQGTPADDVERLVVEWPSAPLRDATLIDTPGLASLSAGASDRTRSFLTSPDRPGQADAVLYLMRHLHADDAAFLEAFRGDAVRGEPVNAIAVVSRADEVAAGRLDAMESAHNIAERYRHDPQVRRLCQTVVPVAGLLAQTGATLTEEEFRALQRLAGAPREDTDRLLLTADRFANSEATIGLTPLEREHLTARLGLFGVRLAVLLLRDGIVTTSSQLADELITRSGIRELRDVLRSQFAGRSEILKARSALLAIQATLDDGANGVARERERLLAEAERIEASAHVFTEMRLLHSLRSGAVRLGDVEIAEAERLLGGGGTSLTDRVGLPPGAPLDEQRKALLTTLERWQDRAESPLSPRDAAEAARVLVRTCEGILADLGALGPPALE
ncbi:MAG: dynamin family protein [Actinomycetota bacterium]